MGCAAAATPTTRVFLFVALSFLMTMASGQGPGMSSCPGDQTFDTDSGEAFYTATLSIPPGFVCDATSNTWPVGVHLVLCSIIGGTNCSFTVTVRDNENPRILNCPVDFSKPLSEGGFEVSWPSLVVTDNVGVINIRCNPANQSSFAAFVGTAKAVNCTAEDEAGNTAAPCTFQVTLIDDVPPTITCPPNENYTTTSGDVTPEWTVVESDSVGVTHSECSPTSGTVFSLGATPVTCTARDAAGNTATCTFTVTVLDGTPPVFTSCPSSPLNKIVSRAEMRWTLPTLTVDTTWDEPSVVDNDGSPPMLESSHRPGDEFPVGVTVVTYNATDQAGNANVGGCTFSVVVTFQPQNEVFATYQTCPSSPCFSVAWTESQDPTVREYTVSAWERSQDESSALQDIVPSVDSTYNRHLFERELAPGELYTVKVEAGVGPSRKLIGTTQAWTVPDAPEGFHKVPGTMSTTSVDVAWQRVSLQNVDQYMIMGFEPQPSYVTKTTDRIVVDNISPLSFLQLYAVVGSGAMRRLSGSKGTIINFHGSFEDSELQAYSTESTIDVYWTATLPSGNDPYMLYIEPEEADENYLTAFGGTNAVFTGLEPNTEYHIRLVHNRGLFLSTSATTKPAPPSNVRPTAVLTDSITLEWGPPTEGDVDSYEVYISPGERTEPVEVSATSHTFSPLTAETEYFLKVVAIYDDARSRPVTLMVTAGVTEPSPPLPLNIVAIALGTVLGVVALLLIIGIVIMCRKYRKLKAVRDTTTSYATAIVEGEQSGKAEVPVKVEVADRPYVNSAVVGRQSGQARSRNLPAKPGTQKQTDEDEYTYVMQQ